MDRRAEDDAALAWLQSAVHELLEHRRTDGDGDAAGATVAPVGPQPREFE